MQVFPSQHSLHHASKYPHNPSMVPTPCFRASLLSPNTTFSLWSISQCGAHILDHKSPSATSGNFVRLVAFKVRYATQIETISLEITFYFSAPPLLSLLTPYQLIVIVIVIVSFHARNLLLMRATDSFSANVARRPTRGPLDIGEYATKPNTQVKII